MNDVSDWWSTAIIDMEPGRISIRGRPIEELIATATFAQVIWLMLRGDFPSEAQAKLLEAALVAGVDHGPQSPSIAAARMAATCGVGINAAMASAVNMLGDVHGGAGEQAVELYGWIADSPDGAEAAAERALERWRAERSAFVPGFGHRFHEPRDPRAPELLSLVERARREGVVEGRHAEAAKAIEALLEERKGKPVPMNIDGASAVVHAELGFAPALSRGLFCLSRSVGIIAHAWEQMNQGERGKGPTPPRYRWTYTG